jgi:hypothetical protein
MSADSPANNQESSTEEKASESPMSALSQTDNSEDAGQPAESTHSRPYKEKALEVAAGLARWTFWERASIVGEALLAGAVAYYAYVQASVSEGQLTAMKDQNVEMIKQSDAAKGQLDSMIEQSKGAAEQSRMAQRQLAIAEGALKISQEQLALSTQQAKDTLAQLRLEQRPWVYVTAGAMETDPHSRRPEMNLTFTNRGKTPAYIKSIRGQLEYVQVKMIPVPENPNHTYADPVSRTAAYKQLSSAISDMPRYPDPGSLKLLLPNEDQPVAFGDGSLITEEQIEAANALDGEIVCVGRIVYEDVNANQYETTFCWRSSQSAED